MSRRSQSLLCVTVATAGLIVFLVVRNAGPSPEPTATPPTKRPAPESKPEAIPSPPAPVEVPPRTRPEIDASLLARLDRLRESFAPGGSKPNRFLLMKELREQWGNSPPVDLLLFEATDPDAPLKYRDYLARTLRNFGKMSPAEARAELAGKMREAMTTSPAGAPHLAHALIAFDDSPASLRTVEARLRTTGDDVTTAGFLAALTMSHATEARTIVLDETRGLTDDPDTYPLSLSIALPPLAREGDLQIEPDLERVLSKTTHQDLFLTVIGCCFVRPPEEPAIQAVGAALERVESFGAEEQERLSQAIRSGLLRWQAQFPGPSSPKINQLLHKLP